MSLKDRIKAQVVAMDLAVRPWAARSRWNGWAMAPIGKLGAWYLLILLSFVLVTLVHPPQTPGEGEATNPLTTPASPLPLGHAG